MLLTLRALDVDLELEIAGDADDVAEMLLALLPSSWERTGRRETAPLLRLAFEKRSGQTLLVVPARPESSLHPPATRMGLGTGPRPSPGRRLGGGASPSVLCDPSDRCAGSTVEGLYPYKKRRDPAQSEKSAVGSSRSYEGCCNPPHLENSAACSYGPATMDASAPFPIGLPGEGRGPVSSPEVLAIAKDDADPQLWLGRLEQEIVAAVARRSSYLWLHAGAVLLNGRALVLPGPSFAGKSTLVDALVGRGAHYLSDEWVAIDGRCRVHALPRPPRLREGRPRPVAEAAGDWPLLATALLRYHPRPASRPRRLAAVDALTELIPHAIGPGEGGGLAGVAAILGRPVFAGFRGEAEVFLDGWLGELVEELPDVA